MRFKICLLIITCFCSATVFAQLQQKITGVILDSATSAPLAGVSITVVGTTNGTASGADGSFTITAPKNASVQFSYVGYNDQVVYVSALGNGIVRMVSNVTGLDDVVVIAYGAQKKMTVTGAVSTVTTEQLKQSSAASLDNALAGRLSGVTSTQNGGGQPGRDDATIFLRGAATSNTNSPLILIDGVPRDNIRTIDPNEVASISVLKDASATAVFGVRGANGVILITTRRGSQGKI